jgi:hypothetical protein
MTDTARTSDEGIGLSLVFGLVALLATLGTLATSYISILNGDGGMQVISGVSFAVAVFAGCVAVAAVHMFGG